MKSDEYQYLEGTLTGRRPRNPQFEEKMEGTPEGAINSKAIERRRQLDSLTPEQRELEQRKYSLRTYGKAHMEKYGNPIISDKPLGELQIPGDQISSQQIHGHNDKSAPSLRAHSGGGEMPEPCQDENGRLILQNHSACAQRQVLNLR